MPPTINAVVQNLKSLKYLKFFIICLPCLSFFLPGLLSLHHYGYIWDEPDHFVRGQAYLHYFLTGQKNYQNLNGVQRSYFQNDFYTAQYFFDNDGGHPPFNDILAAFTNYMFYQKLNALGDIESFHLFSLMMASLLVLVVAIFAYQVSGVIAGLVAGFSLALYPLFWGEAHFNIKDPVETGFFGITIWFFWLSLQKKNWKFLLMSVISFSFALATKFNILFLPLIVFPYLALTYKKRFWEVIIHPFTSFGSLPKGYVVALAVSPFLVFFIFFAVWPYLWLDAGRLFWVFGYYAERGVSTSGEAGIYLPGGFNLYPLIWIFATTPPFVLFLSFMGIISAFFSAKKKNGAILLWILWLMVPILRVTFPHTRIYGGVRQIMEYIPALSLLSGIGAVYFIELLTKKIPFGVNKIRLFSSSIVLLCFVPQLFILIKLHPNENVYFNSLVGGLKGAYEKKIPYSGNSFGNAYFQGVRWLNLNANKNARLALLQKVDWWIYPPMLRQDIQYRGGYFRSGIRREGEYILELTHQNAIHSYNYIWEYVNKFLGPVYEVKADGVAIARVWKNDLEHTMPTMRLREVIYKGKSILNFKRNVGLVELPEDVLLSRIVIQRATQAQPCAPIMGDIETSNNGIDWQLEVEHLQTQQLVGKSDKNLDIEFFFAARKARFIKLLPQQEYSCFDIQPRVGVYILQ